MARRATIIAQTRKQNENVLLLDAGDSLTGDQDPARKTQGAISVAVMNKLGYDAMALGPQDLSLGSSVLQQRMAEAKFAILSANAVISATGELLAKPFVIRKLGGRQIALVGLSGVGTGETANTGMVNRDVAVRDPLETTRAIVPQVKKQADVVILLSHAGVKVDQQIADSVPGIALIVSGGPFALDTPWRSAKTGTLIWHADEAMSGHAGRTVGVGTFAVEPSGQVAQPNWKRVNLSPDVADDPMMDAWVKQQ